MKLISYACRALIVCLLASTNVALAAYPERPIKLLVGFTAGGATDAIARFYAMKLNTILKQPVIVENRGGAYQLVAIRALMSAKPDGYTLFIGTASAMSQDIGFKDQLPFSLPYDPLKDFTNIALVGTTQGVLIASKSIPVTSVAELIKYAKQNPGKLNYGSSGIGSASHLQMEYLSALTGIKMTHIPYHSTGEILTSIAQGSVQLGMSEAEGSIPAVRAGLARPLGVTGNKRLEALPDVPTLSQTGFPNLSNIDPLTYYVLVGPKGMSKDIVDKLNSAINTVSKMPETITYMHRQDYEPAVSTPASTQAFIEKDSAKWRAVSKQIKLDLGNK